MLCGGQYNLMLACFYPRTADIALNLPGKESGRYACKVVDCCGSAHRTARGMHKHHSRRSEHCLSESSFSFCSHANSVIRFPCRYLDPVSVIACTSGMPGDTVQRQFPAKRTPIPQPLREWCVVHGSLAYGRSPNQTAGHGIGWDTRDEISLVAWLRSGRPFDDRGATP